ncbi:flagellar assembly protein FliH [Orrella sp. JC864]|uniref:flagellar assembly protein FliH n=1 Tax=Orrella sp. JC864 TaxID=3120298 RepID=UPI003FA731B0
MSEAPYAGLAVRERKRAWRRWQMEAFDLQAEPDAASAAGAPDPDEPSEAEQAAEREARIQAACRQGWETGHQEGYARGLQEGREAGHAQGLEQGRKEGYEAGLAEGRDQAVQHAQALAALARACADSLAGIEAEMGQALLTLSLDIARQVLRDTLSAQPEKILPAIREVLHADNRGAEPLRLWVNGRDHALVSQHLADDLAAQNWQLLTDDALAPGGCRAETAYGTIDATLQTRWRRVAASLGKVHEWDGGSAAP